MGSKITDCFGISKTFGKYFSSVFSIAGMAFPVRVAFSRAYKSDPGVNVDSSIMPAAPMAITPAVIPASRPLVFRT